MTSEPLVIIQNGTVYAPEPVGQQAIVMAAGQIIQMGEVDSSALQAAGFECQVIDAEGCLVMPGLIDPHQHLIGAGGEQGFTSRMPEIGLEQIVYAGITTVVGLLGTDTVTRMPTCLYAKTQQINQEGLTARMYTGGFELPPRTITDSAMDDMVLIDPVIGTGEVAISDPRWIDPPLHDLAHLVIQTQLGGQMSGKAGVTHFHVGPGKGKLDLLETLLDEYDIEARSIYPTHITRSTGLMRQAIKLAGRGAYVDMDSIEENIVECLGYYLEHDGPPSQLTVSSDSHTPGGSPARFFAQFVACLREGIWTPDEVLPFFSTNAADALKLEGKGCLKVGADGDVLILRQDTYELVHVFAKGRHFVEDGRLAIQSEQQQLMEKSRP